MRLGSGTDHSRGSCAHRLGIAHLLAGHAAVIAYLASRIHSYGAVSAALAERDEALFRLASHKDDELWFLPLLHVGTSMKGRCALDQVTPLCRI